MPEKAVYLLVVEGFADWEPAHAVAELRRQGHYKVESVGLTSAAVRSSSLTLISIKSAAQRACCAVPSGIPFFSQNAAFSRSTSSTYWRTVRLTLATSTS